MSHVSHRTVPSRFQSREERQRGRLAERPHELGRKGLLDALRRVKNEIRDDDVGMMAAGMAFFAMLALFPALIALVTLYGLFASPLDVERQLSSFAAQLPAGAADLVRDQLHGIVATSSSALGLGFVVSLAAAIWTASSGAVGMIKGVNRAYDEEATRSSLKTRLLAIAFTLGGVLMVGVAIFLVGVLPTFFDAMGLGSTGKTAVSILRWLGLGLLAVVGLGAVYRYAPVRDHPKVRWVSWGAVLATLAWLGATALFGFYVSHFGSYQATYGALGGVIVLLLWLFISAFAVLLGAELNSEMEGQTARDSTVGPAAPMGERDAAKAHIVGRARTPAH
jgi:membrane protein